MIDDILTEIGNLRFAFVIYGVIVVLLCGALWFFTKSFDFRRYKTTLFAFLFNLEYKQVFCLGLIFGRLLFTLCAAILCMHLNLGYLIIYVIFAALLTIISRNYSSLPSELFNSIAVFALLFIERSLYVYYVEYEHLFAVLLMVILLGIFAFLYMTLQSLGSYSRLLDKSESKIMIKKRNKKTKEELAENVETESGEDDQKDKKKLKFFKLKVKNG